ncbi:trypsin-1-like [Musca vetustissima]|uniref:trypsin-1-like n=1 Tax=Musca vetustissima TaxID=27455 RepID=UPI002AB7A888|nr:trypsin-1-like [Musca vetustissima]
MELQGFLKCLIFIYSLLITHALTPQWDSRIINGTEVTWNNTRYQVSIRMKVLDRVFFGIGHVCGGSLIGGNDNQQKFHSPQDYSIVMGNLDRTKKDGNTLQLSVKDIIVGPNFDPETFEDDITIMILNQTVPSNYRGASLIELNENANLTAGTKCTVSGWGLTEKGYYAQTLRLVEVPLISHSVCSEHYGDESLTAGMLCAGYMSGGRDACSADSGGPLVCDDTLVGIVSFGVGCAKPGFPGVYTNVAYYIDWIRNKTGSKLQHVDDLSPINAYFNYTIIPYAKNSTGGSNSTHEGKD